MTTKAAEQTNFHSLAAVDKLHDLLTGEIKLASQEAGRSVNELTKTFMEMVRDVHEILAQAESLNRDNLDSGGKQGIVNTCNKFLDKVQAGTIGFQFYDKLTQRLYHSTRTLSASEKLFASESKFADAEAWNALWADMNNRYNTEQDREMHQQVMEGKSVKDALALAGNGQSENDVELF